jgi:hypothetical protein
MYVSCVDLVRNTLIKLGAEVIFQCVLYFLILKIFFRLNSLQYIILYICSLKLTPEDRYVAQAIVSVNCMNTRVLMNC